MTIANLSRYGEQVAPSPFLENLMAIAYNPFLVAKMLDRAGHPGTPDQEALVAVRKAYEHSSTRGKTLSEIAQFVNEDIYADAKDMRHAELLNDIAELTVARDDAKARVRAQAETIAEVRRARDEAAMMIEGLRAEIAALGEKLAGQPVVSPVEPVLIILGDGVPPVNGPAIEMPPAAVLCEFNDDRPDCDEAISSCEAEPVGVSAPCETTSPHEAETPIWFDWAEYARFAQLAALGRARSSIARTLSREFGGRFSVQRVSEMMRERWLSPVYLRMMGMSALTG